MSRKIDLVVLYVNESDKSWQDDFNYYKNKEITQGIQKPNGEQNFSSCRIRDWNIFRYFFRGVEQNCSWIRKIFLIVQRESQLPEWLDTTNKKLRIVYHDEYIPKEYLPTFNNFVMESFLYNIPDLSDNFIIGCDDFFFINSIDPYTFFDRRYTANQECLELPFKYHTPEDSSWAKMTNNSLRFLSKFDDTKMNPYQHLFEARNKKWEKEWFIPRYGNEIFESLKISRFRHDNNILPTVFADTMRLLDITNHKNIYGNSAYIRMKPNIDLMKYVDKDMICINDTRSVTDFEICKAKAITFLNHKFKEKSSFELSNNIADVKWAENYLKGLHKSKQPADDNICDDLDSWLRAFRKK